MRKVWGSMEYELRIASLGVQSQYAAKPVCRCGAMHTPIKGQQTRIKGQRRAHERGWRP